MPQTAQVIPLRTATARRFTIADLSEHGKWVMPRFLKLNPHLDERSAIGFLNGIIFNREYLFLYQPDGVAMAQVMTAHALAPRPVVWERFVWARDPKDTTHIEQASHFYTEMSVWSKSIGADTIIVRQSTDVPELLLKERLGRLFISEQYFARL